jgi:serine/threonine-protein phosphatase 2A regulatory subunit A
MDPATSTSGTNAVPLHPLAILIDELKSEDLPARLNAVHRLSTIALALGPERTREELVPFLHDSLDDEDEVLLALAEELGNLREYVGGDQYAYLLLGPLENLAAVEETLVRDKVRGFMPALSKLPSLSSCFYPPPKAAESINKISPLLTVAQIEEHYLPLLRRLSEGEWFTARTSSTALYASIYTRATEAAREEMRRMFAKLCADETPMVRRAAAKELGVRSTPYFFQLISGSLRESLFVKEFSKKVPKALLISDLLPAFRKLAGDDQDSVRLLTVDAMIDIAEVLDDEECKTLLGPTMKAMVADKSWRVRYMVADHFVKLATAAGQDIVKEDLVSAFASLLKDNEAEVRTAAAGQIPGKSRLRCFA